MPEQGAVATEYALVMMLIAMAVFGAVLVFGQRVAAMFEPVLDLF